MPNPNSVFIVDGVRSPFGRFGGGLRDVPVVDLARQTLQALMARTSWSVDRVSELNAGMAMIEGGLMVPARQFAVAAGFPESLPTLTIDRACCSGMTVVGLGLRAVAGGAHSALALGIESMLSLIHISEPTRPY